MFLVNSFTLHCDAAKTNHLISSGKIFDVKLCHKKYEPALIKFKDLLIELKKIFISDFCKLQCDFDICETPKTTEEPPTVPIEPPVTTEEPTIEPPVTRAPVTRHPVTRAPVTRASVTRDPITRHPVTRPSVTIEHTTPNYHYTTPYHHTTTPYSIHHYTTSRHYAAPYHYTTARHYTAPRGVHHYNKASYTHPKKHTSYGAYNYERRHSGPHSVRDVSKNEALSDKFIAIFLENEDICTDPEIKKLIEILNVHFLHIEENVWLDSACDKQQESPFCECGF